MTSKGTITSKNLLPIAILNILKDHTDNSHHLLEKEIIAYLGKEYKVDPLPEYKSIGRTIERLQNELDIDIFHDRQGFWMGSRDLEDYELQMLIDCVFSSRYISKDYSKKLRAKLLALGGDYFAKRKTVALTYSMDNLDKTDNKALFINMDVITNAIEQEKQIEYDFNKYGADMQLHFSRHHIVSPLMFIVHNQRYYLMLYHEDFKQVQFHRLDHMTNINIIDKSKITSLRNVKGWEDGIKNEKLTARPYMFADTPERVTFLVNKNSFDTILDWLGYNIEIEKIIDKEDKLKVSVRTSPKAMKYFALQMMDSSLEIVSPKHLRDEVKESLAKAVEMYKD